MLTPEQLIEGEIYFHDTGNYKWIIRALKSTDRVLGSSHIVVGSEAFYDGGYVNSRIKELREATQKEKAHLLACEKAGKYVEAPKLPQEITFSIF